MAAAPERIKSSKMFWISDDDVQPLAIVPGENRRGTTRTNSNASIVESDSTYSSGKRGAKMRIKHFSLNKSQAIQRKPGNKHNDLQNNHFGAFIQETISTSQSTAQTHPPTTFCFPPQVIPETNLAKGDVSLKDLCPEDKKRIANLVQELARVSEEKEESMQRLKDEQENFERKIQQLEEQNLIIAKERESLQQQYKECQQLLVLYQQYLSQQHAELNQSIARLNQSTDPPKVLSSEEASGRTSTSRASSSAFDGSYVRAQQAHAEHGGGHARRKRMHTFRNPAPHPCEEEFSPAAEPIRQHSSETDACLRCGQIRDSPHDSVNRTLRVKSKADTCRGNCHHDTSGLKSSDRLPRGSFISSEYQETPTEPLLGHVGWEEKRHQLLMQKMFLEKERERLKARLVEQEERFSRQTEQLQQSRLDYSRLQQDAQDKLTSSLTSNKRTEPEGPSHKNLSTSVCKDEVVPPAAPNMQDKPPTVPVTLANKNSDQPERTRHDMATSPAVLSNHTASSAFHTNSRTESDFSVVELLDIFSPISAPEHQRPKTQRRKTSQQSSTISAPRSVSRSFLNPRLPYHPSTGQDPEENQILEDIFFIC